MTPRYTRRDADRAFQRIMAHLGKNPTTYQRGPDGTYSTEVGTWYLDYNPTYGGCVVHEVVNASMGVTTPLGDQRLTPREFCEAVSFAIRALEVAETARDEEN